MLYRILGWLLLQLLHRNKEKREHILKEKYDNSYLNAGAEYPLKIAASILLLILFAFFGVVIYSIFKHGPAPV